MFPRLSRRTRGRPTTQWPMCTVRNSLRFGFNLVHNGFGFFQLAAPSGSLSFTGTYTNNPVSPSGTGAGFADFLLGLPVSSSKSLFGSGIPYDSYTEYGAFIQDQWR